MLSLDQIKKAYDLKQQKLNLRDISKEIGCAANEISYSLNTYKLCKDYYEKIINTITPGEDQAEKIKKEYDKLDALHVEIREQEKKVLDREAWVKLFVKNIIYKYRVKNRNLDEQLKKYRQEFDKNTNDIKEENFSLYYDLQKASKEKTDILEEFEKYKILIKFKYIALFLSGSIFGVLSIYLVGKFV